MGSLEANGQEQAPNRRPNIKHARRRGLPKLEWFEDRTLLGNGTGWQPSTTNLADVRNGPMANLGSQLINLYETFHGGQTDPAALSSQFPLLQIKNSTVLVGLTADTDFPDRHGFCRSGHRYPPSDAEINRYGVGLW